MALQVSPPPLLSFFVAFPLITNHTVPLPPILKKKKSFVDALRSVISVCFLLRILSSEQTSWSGFVAILHMDKHSILLG